MFRIIGTANNKIYFEGTRADCNKWLIETYPSIDEHDRPDGFKLPSILPQEMRITEVRQ